LYVFQVKLCRCSLGRRIVPSLGLGFLVKLAEHIPVGGRHQPGVLAHMQSLAYLLYHVDHVSPAVGDGFSYRLCQGHPIEPLSHQSIAHNLLKVAARPVDHSACLLDQPRLRVGYGSPIAPQDGAKHTGSLHIGGRWQERNDCAHAAHKRRVKLLRQVAHEAPDHPCLNHLWVTENLKDLAKQSVLDCATTAGILTTLTATYLLVNLIHDHNARCILKASLLKLGDVLFGAAYCRIEQHAQIDNQAVESGLPGESHSPEGFTGAGRAN